MTWHCTAVVALLTAAVVTACAGCEHGITVHGKVNIPLEVQRQFSREAPGIVVMGGGSGGSTVYAELLGALCDPGTENLVVPFNQDHNGCAAEGTLWFWVTRLAPVDRASVACGLREESLSYLISNDKLTVPDSFDKNKTVASAVVPIFAGKGGVCRSGDETIDATVKLTP